VINIFLGTSYEDTPTGELKKKQVISFKDFCQKYLSTCLQGKKNDYYVTIGDEYALTPASPDAPALSYKASDHYHRNNKSQLTAWLLPFDGDSSKSSNSSCIAPLDVHEALIKLGYTHVIYTTHSHIPRIKNRWRLFIPCKMTSPKQLSLSVNYLYKQLVNAGCDDLELSSESKTWSVPWYLPTRDFPEDGNFEYYEYFDGVDFLAIDSSSPEAKIKSENTEESRTVTAMLEIIAKGGADTGLHKATRDLAYGLVKDGCAPGTVKAILHFISNYSGELSPRQSENISKIDSLVDSATMKVLEEIKPNSDWDAPGTISAKIYTVYPNQHSMMEELVQTCLKWMPYPNRQIAVIAAHSLISVLGGRTYTLENGSGIVLTALVTGRSTIGKSFIKKFCIFCLNNFQLANVSQDFIGSHFYTSSKNLVQELSEAGSLLSVRTESGQSDKSNAGDMTRVLMYELELATESGSAGYVSSGGQNEKIPSLFSPAVTTIRESVAQIQNEADVINATAVSGVAGRRSHVLIDPIKPSYNENQLRELPANIKSLILSLYKKAANEQRKKVTEPLPKSLWTVITYKNPQYLAKKRTHWIEKENRAAVQDMHFESTFYGRLGERLPSWAARLAIVDNIENPIITNEHIDIAEESLIAELSANDLQQDSGELDSDINQTVTYILDLFKGDMTKKATLINNNTKNMLKDGACVMSTIMSRASARGSYKKAAPKIPQINNILLSTLKTRGIVELTRDEAKEKYNYNGRVLKRS